MLGQSLGIITQNISKNKEYKSEVQRMLKLSQHSEEDDTTIVVYFMLNGWLAKTFVHLKKVFFSLLFKREKIPCTLKMIFQHFSVNIDQVTLKEYSRIQIGR